MGYTGLDEKVIVVTGAAQGIGAAYVRRLVAEGATVIAADLNLDGVEKLAASLGERVVPVAIDVSSVDSCRALADRLAADYGRCDGIINNAAIFSTIRMAPFWEITEREWDLLMNVNLKGVWQLSTALFELFKASGKASIVNIGSDSVPMGRTNYLHYTASKAAVTGMTYGMSKELGGFGIRVNTLSPGPVYTEIDRDTVTEEQTKAMLANTALGRKAGPDDMTAVAAFLLSDDSGYVTGQTISVNGGLYHR